MPDQTYLHIRTREGGPETRGTAAYSLGHKIDRGRYVKPDGVFFEWSWDGRQLTACNDRYGFYPLYYCYRRGEVFLSPSIREILAQGAPNDFDYDALSVFLRLGWYLGEDTPFKYIKLLPPDATFVYKDGLLNVSGNYTTKKPIHISEDDAIDEYIRLFRQSMKRRLPARVLGARCSLLGGCLLGARCSVLGARCSLLGGAARWCCSVVGGRWRCSVVVGCSVVLLGGGCCSVVLGGGCSVLLGGCCSVVARRNSCLL